MKINNRFTALISCLMALALLLAGCDGIIPGGTGESTAPADTGSPTDAPTQSAGSPAPSASAGESPGGEATPPSASAAPEDTATPSPSPTLEPTPSPTPTPEPTVEPTPHPGDRADVTVEKYFDSKLPEGLAVNLKYTRYSYTLDYFVVLKSSAIRELPNASAKSLQSVKLAQRYPMIAEVKGADGKVWYRVNAGSKGIGYLPATAGSPRFFQVDKAWKEILTLQEITNQTGTVRVSNYKNVNGKPPLLPEKKETDKYGNRRDQAAPAYLAPDKASSFCYMPDGSLGQMLSTKSDFIEVYFPSIDEVRYVPKKYISSKKEAVSSLTQVIIVDRKNQNNMTLEFVDGTWSIASMSYVSTGKKGGYSLPTPLGYFAAIEKKRPGKYKLGEFWYLHDGADPNADDLKFSGYAPYAIRFTGGAYLHGLPVSVKYDPVTNELIMPKNLTYESSTSLGTTPQSHMCVRNYTSHAKYMYDWVKIGEAAVIVIE